MVQSCGHRAHVPLSQVETRLDSFWRWPEVAKDLAKGCRWQVEGGVCGLQEGKSLVKDLEEFT